MNVALETPCRNALPHPRRTHSEPNPVFLSPLSPVGFLVALQRSLGVLAELFGGDSGARAPPAADNSSGASSSPVPALGSGAAVPDNVGGADAASPSVPNHTETQGGDSGGNVVLPTLPDEQQQHQQVPPERGEATAPGASVAAEAVPTAAAAPGEERFVAHMSTLTDIFTVRDKVSTKKSKEEKDKDKGFKVASLFDGLAGGEDPQPAAAAVAAAPAPALAEKEGGFSFGFGSGAAGVPPTDPAEGQSQQVPSPRHSPGVLTASATASGQSTDSRPGLTPPSAASPLQETETALWRPLGDLVAVAARFVRTGKREDVEAAWLGERRALTQDFKRKHKDAVKGRRGAGAAGAASKKRTRR